MESNGVPGRVHVSESAKKLGHKTNPQFTFTDRGNIEIAVREAHKTTQVLIANFTYMK